MKRTRISWAAGLVRLLFFLILVFRLVRTAGIMLPELASGTDWIASPTALWEIGKMLVDLGFLGLLWKWFDRIWVAPATFLWLSLQTIVSVEGSAVTLGGLKVLAFSIPFLLLAGILVGKLFSWSGIQGRILLVCLASAGLPMFYLALALGQQSLMIIDKAFFPMARIIIEADLKRLNASLIQRLNQDVQGLLGLSPGASGSREIPLVDEATYGVRAASLAIPLESAYEVIPTFGTGTPSTSEAEASLQAFLSLLQKKFDGSFELRTQDSGQKLITLKGRRDELEKVLREVQGNSELAAVLDPGSIIIQSPPSSRLSTLHLSLLHAGSSPNPLFRDFADRFPEGKHDALAYSIYSSPDSHLLTIRLPKREGDLIAGGMVLSINLRAWVTKTLEQEMKSEAYLIRCFFPCTLERITRDFEGYQTGWMDEARRPFDPLQLGFPFSEATSFNGSRPSPGEGLFSPAQEPRWADHAGFRNLMVHSPRHAEYVLECWDLPFCRSSVFVGLDSDHVWLALFRSQAKFVIYCFLAVLMAGFMSLVYSDRLSVPIQEITKAAGEIRSGKLHCRIPEQTGEGEIEELASSLNLMAQQLTGRITLANQQLRAEKERFEILVESTWEGIFLLDGTGRLIYANHSGRQLLGALDEGAVFPDILKKLGSDFQPALPDPWNPAQSEFRSIFQIPCGSQGNRKFLALYIRACQHEEQADGTPSLPSGFIAVLRDVSVEREIDRMKSDFVSQVSHELRTPLTSIKAFTEMLLDGEVEDLASQKEYLRITFDEAERLTRLISDLLDIARIESGRRPLKLCEIDLNALSREAVEVMKGQIEKARQTITLQLPPEPVSLMGDADLLKQAALNLLSNASKYTPSGGALSLKVEPAVQGKVAWIFTDSGIGLTPQDKARLFDKFFRADSEVVRAAGGTGLGLALVKNIVDLHQGEIRVDSVYEKGSTFTVIMPTGKSQEENPRS